MVVRSADVDSIRQWDQEPFGGRESSWLQFIRRHPARLGFGLAIFLLLVGWFTRDLHYLSADKGLGYALGIVSLTCMAVLLTYPLRKRVRFFKFLGPLPKIFRNHMVLGVSAPIAALYHCNFQLGSLNSRIALFSALLVAGSGLIGRFIYRKIHLGLYGRKTNLKELLARVKLHLPDEQKLGNFAPELMKRITRFDRQVLVPPKGILDSVRLPIVLAIKTRLQYWRLAIFTRLSLMYAARRSSDIARYRLEFERATLEYVRTHLRQVRRVAEFNAYERLFALWHKVHIPFFVLLFVSVIVHALAVHLY